MRRLVRLSLLIVVVSAGCVRAPPPMLPFPSGGVIQSQDSAGEIIGGVGGASDLLNNNLAAALTGRVRLGRSFDLGIGGLYGASGLPNTYLARVSPRWYFARDRFTAFAFEIGLGGGVYQGAELDVSSQGVSIPTYRVPVGSVDAEVRFGNLVSDSVEVSWALGVFDSFAGTAGCPNNLNGARCQDHGLYHAGGLGQFGVAYTHPSGFTVGGETSLTLGYAPNLFGLNISASALLTIGYRFGYLPRIWPPLTPITP